MKNLFKFSLCAFAALMLANCTNDLTEDGAQAPVERFSMTINAGSPDDDDSRTALGTDDNGKYRIVWHAEGETLTIAEVVDGNIPDSNTCEATQMTDRGTEKFAVFTTSFAGASDVNKRYTYVACYPHSEANEFNPAAQTVTTTMPAVQTPVEGSVDPKATLLFAQHKEESQGRPYQIDLKFAHAAAYAKMTLKGLPLYSAGYELGEGHAVTKMPHDEIIDKIIITCTGANLAGKGAYSYSLDEDGKSKLEFQSASDGSETITLNVKDLEITKAKTNTDNGYTIFFAALPAVLENPEITITTVDGRTFTKTLNTSDGKEIKLTQGSVFAFTVGANNLNPTETDLVYTRVYSRQPRTDDFGSLVKVDDEKTEFDSKEFIMLTMNGDAAYTFKNRDIDGTLFSKGVTVKNSKGNYENFYLDNAGNNLYYTSGNDANEGKAADYTWIWDKSSNFASSVAGTGAILSTAAEANYLSSNDGNLTLDGTKTNWTLDKNNTYNAYFRIYAGSNMLGITASSASLAALNSNLPVSSQVFIYTDEGLKFVKREAMDIIPEEQSSTYYKYNTEKLVAFNKAKISATSEIKTKHTPLVITATADGKTYLISNECSSDETPELIEVGEEFTLSDNTITGKLNSYVWDAAYDTTGPGYIFNAYNHRANGDGLLYINNTTTTLVMSSQYPAQFVVTPKLDKEGNATGNYSLNKNNSNQYLTIENGRLVVSTTAPTDVYFQFYGDNNQDIEDLAKEEAEEKNNTDPNAYFDKFTGATLEVGAEYIITSGDYTITNTGTGNRTSVSLSNNGFSGVGTNVLTIDKELAGSYTFTVEAGYKFRTPSGYCLYRSLTNLSIGSYTSSYTPFTYTYYDNKGALLSYGSGTTLSYIYLNGTNWQMPTYSSSLGNYTYLTLYKKRQ